MNPGTKKTLAIIAAIVVIGSIIALIIWQLSRPKSFEYEVVVFPFDSTLTVDGQPVQPGNVTLAEGEHTLKATRQYFDDAVVVVNTNELQEGQQIFVLPQATSPEALKWLEENPEQVGTIGEMMSATEVAEDNQIITERYPIVDQLPYNSIDYKIDFSLDADLNIAFTITLYPYAKPGDTASKDRQLKQFKTAALQFLSDNGIDINAVPITYNPAEAASL